jgi:hypothetical protein
MSDGTACRIFSFLFLFHIGSEKYVAIRSFVISEQMRDRYCSTGTAQAGSERHERYVSRHVWIFSSELGRVCFTIFQKGKDGICFTICLFIISPHLLQYTGTGHPKWIINPERPTKDLKTQIQATAFYVKICKLDMSRIQIGYSNSYTNGILTGGRKEQSRP